MRGGWRQSGKDHTWDQRPARGSRGRGPRYGYPSRSAHGRTLISTAPAPPLGELIQSISKDDLAKDSKLYLDAAKIQDCSLVASYSWLEGGDPTILVPGKPPRWTPPKGETKLPEDSGDYFRDSNAAAFPTHLMESTVLAALSLAPDIPGDVDLVSDVASLGNLLRFVLDKEKSFRVLVQVINGTVFFVRRENSPTETLDGIRGHGHTFPEAYTTWDADVTGSLANHRVMKYRFGELRMLVRYEADAYVAEGMMTGISSPTDGLTDLDGLIAGLSTGKQTTTSTTSKKTIKLVQSSTLSITPQSQIADIKTRGAWKRATEDTVAEEFPKLWLGQIPSFIVAYHTKGTFEADIQVRNVRSRVDAWETDSKREIACFAALLHRVLGLVGKGGGKLELVRTGVGVVEVRRWGEGVGEMLSEGTKGRWRGGEDGTEEVVGDGGADLGVEGWGDEGEKDWAECSAACNYCGECKRKGCVV